MKKITSFCLVLGICLVLPLLIQAKAYKVNEIPMVHLQDRTRYVSNPDGVLSPEAVAAIDTTLFALEQQTGTQVLVVAVKEIDGGDCFDFAYQLGQQNGVGQKGKDNGLVVLLVTEERCIQFATGYGLEGSLPDAACKQIQIRYMNKPFSQGNWDAGMVAGIQAIRRQLDGTGEPLGNTNNGDDGGFLLFLIPFLCIFLLVPLFIWYSNRQRRKCPACHKHTLNEISQRTVAKVNGYKIIEVNCLCKHCGYTCVRQKKVQDDDFRGGMGGPFIGPFFGGGHRGGGFGGGFGGGSFGGGSFGGGGAGSKF